jgi:hypothetical protein
MRELTRANRPAMREDKQAKLPLIVADGIAARKRTIEQRDIKSGERVCRIRIRRRKGAGRGAAPCRARPCPIVAIAAARHGLREKGQKESSTMRIIVRVLGIALGGCLLALFLYIILALPGVLSDRDSFVALTTPQRAPAQR